MGGVEGGVVEEEVAGEGFGIWGLLVLGVGFGVCFFCSCFIVWGEVVKGRGYKGDVRSGSNCRMWMLQSASATAM